MRKSLAKPKSRTKSRPSRSTKRSKESTPTSRSPRRVAAVANALYSQTLRPKLSSQSQVAIVEGISMWPCLKAGYRVKYRSLDPAALEPGDIIVVSSHGRKGEPRQKVHRFLGRVGQLYLEAGDNSFSCSLLTGDEIVGRVEEVRDWAGKKVSLPHFREHDRKFQFFLATASVFVFTHELKNRILGSRRSYLLWKASEAYRAGLQVIGLKVPVITPSV